MASTITSRGATFTTTAGNKTVTATPAVGDLIVVICANSGRTTAQPPTVTDNNSSGTYTQISTSCTKNTSADSMWVFIRNTTIASASSTIFTMTQSSDTGGGLQVWSATNISFAGQNAVRQAAKQDNQAASGTPTPVLGVAALTGNALVGAVFNATNPATMTPRGTPAWTESNDLGYITPTSGLETMFINSGETGTSIAWGGTSASAFCSIVVELDCSVPANIPGAFYPPQLPQPAGY